MLPFPPAVPVVLPLPVVLLPLVAPLRLRPLLRPPRRRRRRSLTRTWVSVFSTKRVAFARIDVHG